MVFADHPHALQGMCACVCVCAEEKCIKRRHSERAGVETKRGVGRKSGTRKSPGTQKPNLTNSPRPARNSYNDDAFDPFFSLAWTLRGLLRI